MNRSETTAIPIRTTFMPTPLPDEHLLSLVARWFFLMNKNSFYQVAEVISSDTRGLNPRAVWRPIYEDLAFQYGQSLSRRSLATKHTLVPYYAPFLEDCGYILSDTTTQVFSRVMPTRQKLVRYATTWRWCPECVEDNFTHYGTSYWHTTHQLPSILHCPDHNCTLLSGCTNCGFSYSGVQQGLPPAEGVCPKCKTQFHSTTAEISRLVKWIEKTSLQLRTVSSSTTIYKIRHAMKEAIGYEDFSSHRTVQQRNSLSTLQKQFIDWLEDELLVLFFKDIGQNKISLSRNTIFKFTSAAYKNDQIPPISILLMLKFLGIEEVLNLDSIEKQKVLATP